jgi:hypothetical protein
MEYADGRQARLGDKVRYSDGGRGIVVCSIDTDEYSDTYPKEQWRYLKKGVLVQTDTMGLVHYEKSDSGMALVERAK